MAKKKQSKRTAFVPTVVFGTAVLGVIPACAIGCGGQSSTGSNSSKDAASDQYVLGVAAVGYCAYSSSGNTCWTVAAIGFDSGSDGSTEAGSDAGGDAAGDATTLTCPPACAVAYMGFDAGLDSGDKG
jgi:hypothetical protein